MDAIIDIDYKIALTAVGILITIISYIPYLHGIFKNRVKPHGLTWTIWTLLTGIAFAAQLSDNGGPGSWLMGFSSFVGVLITVLAFYKGELDYTRSDIISFIIALASIPIWYITNNPLWTVILVTFIDAVAFFPTFRKSYTKPWDEVIATYFLSGIKFLLGIIALENFTIVTVLYPASLVCMNTAFCCLLFYRRKFIAYPTN